MTTILPRVSRPRWSCGTHGASAFAVIALVATVAGAAHAESALHPGAIAVEARGAFTSVEGSTSGSMGLGGARLSAARGVLLRYGIGADYSRVADLDALAFEGAVVVLRRIGESSAYPFIGPAAAVRQEWVGSFSQNTFPVGFDAGILALTSPGAAFSVAYQFRRVLDDPVSNYNEYRVVFGLMILFHNREGNTQ